MTKERNLFPFLFIFLGLTLSFILFFFDRWQNTHQYPFIFSWSVIILAFMILGIAIAIAMSKIFNKQSKREESIQGEHQRLNNLFNSLPGIVIVLAENCKVRFVNRNYIMKFGECEGQFCFEVEGKTEPCEHCLTKKVFRDDLPVKSEELLLNNRVSSLGHPLCI